jgi:hypothetical protein
MTKSPSEAVRKATEWNAAHPEAHKQHMKNYYESHKEQTKDYYESRKEVLNRRALDRYYAIKGSGIADKFTCDVCSYNTNIKQCYQKHLQTKKHTKNLFKELPF